MNLAKPYIMISWWQVFSPDGGHAGPVCLQSLNSSLDNLWMAGQSQVIVCTEVKNRTLAGGQIDRDILGRGDHLLRLPCPGLGITS